MSSLRPLVVAAFFLVISGLLVILGCTVVPKRNAWPLMSLAIYCLTPVPFHLCGGRDEDGFGDASSVSHVCHTFGLLLGGALLVSGPTLALVLYHTGIISGQALTLTLCGGLSFLLTSLTIVYANRGESEADDEEGTSFF